MAQGAIIVLITVVTILAWVDEQKASEPDLPQETPANI